MSWQPMVKPHPPRILLVLIVLRKQLMKISLKYTEHLPGNLREEGRGGEERGGNLHIDHIVSHTFTNSSKQERPVKPVHITC